MKLHSMTCAVLMLLTASCATTPIPDYSLTPPAPGPDVYRCVNDNGHASFVLVKPGTRQLWKGDHWNPNSCADPANRCKTDDEGLIVIETTSILPTSRDRVDTIDIYNLEAGTVLSSFALNGLAVRPSRDTCAPHS